MQAADAEARADDLLAHVADEASADLSHPLVVVLDRVEGVVEVWGTSVRSERWRAWNPRRSGWA